MHTEVQSDDLASGAALLRSAVPIVDADGVAVGVVVVSQVLAADVNSRAVAATAAYESYQAKKVLKGPLQRIYQSVFLAISLLILMSATWLGLYLAKRITRPVQMLAEGARAIGAGQFDLPRLEPEAGDESYVLPPRWLRSFRACATTADATPFDFARLCRSFGRRNGSMRVTSATEVFGLRHRDTLTPYRLVHSRLLAMYRITSSGSVWLRA